MEPFLGELRSLHCSLGMLKDQYLGRRSAACLPAPTCLLVDAHRKEPCMSLYMYAVTLDLTHWACWTQ
jgi:hypothetical protein